MDDIRYMRRALHLARRGAGTVSPNPMVGAVIVKNGEIIAEGYHTRFGGPHAEVVALDRMDESAARGSTLYVNLEPCSHYGKTPPCTEAIIGADIARVVVGIQDPNPSVAGRGILALQSAGITVDVGVLKQECLRLNASFFKFIRHKKPYITLKVAQTLDGQIATEKGLSRWITSEPSRRLVHRLRREADAVLVGVNTVIQDDPELNVRLASGKGGGRIILDSRLRIPLEAKLLHLPDVDKTIVATTDSAFSTKMEALRQKGITLWKLKKDRHGWIDLSSLWKKIAEENIASLLVEGGGSVFTNFLKSGEVDRVLIFMAPKLFGSGKSSFGQLGIDDPDKAITFKEVAWRRIGQDMLFDGRF